MPVLSWQILRRDGFSWCLWAAIVCVCAVPCFGQSPGSATLQVQLQAQPSIQLVFQNSPNAPSAGYCALSNAGTNNVGLDLGQATLFNNTSSCAAFTGLEFANGTIGYQVSSSFEVVVSKANSSSASYNLQAMISSAPPAGVVWTVSNKALTSGGYTTLDTADGYGQQITKTLGVFVGYSVGAQTLSETITFLATAN